MYSRTSEWVFAIKRIAMWDCTIAACCSCRPHESGKRAARCINTQWDSFVPPLRTWNRACSLRCRQPRSIPRILGAPGVPIIRQGKKRCGRERACSLRVDELYAAYAITFTNETYGRTIALNGWLSPLLRWRKISDESIANRSDTVKSSTCEKMFSR